MTAIEVLEWLEKYEYSRDDMCFNGMDILNVFEKYTPQEILSRIEKYEAEKNGKDTNVPSNTSSVLESINIIDCLNDQIMAILDLLVCQSEEGIVDIKSVSMAADMVSNMQLDLMAEVEKIGEVLKE